MRRYTKQLADGLIARGYKVEHWFPKPYFYKMPVPATLRKWLGYIDQYILFHIAIRKRIRKCSNNTLFVFTDHALGPWVPLVVGRTHVIHCHDFLAQRSALGEIPENAVNITGKIYQALIRNGFTKGKNFISVSEKTRDDLQRFLPVKPLLSEVVYNALSGAFLPGEPDTIRSILSQQFNIDLSGGYILHVGGNQWYKNRSGTIAIYNAWRSTSINNIPLLLVGEAPDTNLVIEREHSLFKESIHFVTELKDEYVCLCYSGATLFLFPSLEEGFGWPVAEAMASGCPVITTRQAPLTEVGGDAACYISRRPADKQKIFSWAKQASKEVERVASCSKDERAKIIEAGIINAKRFNNDIFMDKIERIYKRIFLSSSDL